MALAPDAALATARDAAAGPDTHATEPREAARLCLLDAFACALRALRDPECARLVGPIVPGATLVCGARVPGTSHTLDPPQAAYSLALLFRWHGADDTNVATPGGHPADTLGGLLAVADYASLQRLAAGRPPLTVDDLVAALLRTHARRSRPPPAEAELRAALAVEAVTLLDGDAAAIERALEFARVGATTGVGRGCCAELNAAGVRDALLAMRSAPRIPGVAVSARPVEPIEGSRGIAVNAELVPAPWPPIDGWRVRQRLLDAVVDHYPPKQAAAIAALLDDGARLGTLPINALVSTFVRN